MKNWYILITALLILDRLAKMLASFYWSANPITITNWLHLTYFLNTKYFTFFQLNNLVMNSLLIIFLLVVLVCIVFFIQKKSFNKFGTNYNIWLISLLFIFIGGASNLFDRLYYGGVIDCFQIVGLNIFNLADVYILVGCLILTKKLFRSSL